MDTKDTDTIVEEAAEKKKKPAAGKKKTEKSEDVTIEAESVGIEIDEGYEQDETLHLAYYDNHAITALILAILSVVTPFLGFGLGGVVGLTLGIIALYQVRQSVKLFENSMTQTAKVLAIIGIILSVLAITLTIVFCVSAMWRINSLYQPNQFYFRPQMTYYHRFF